ncbi:AGC protein kinase [Aphelenchoides bicaudatus]|nr:AGC protein kinase [Aphelenchoides bicaudatus]
MGNTNQRPTTTTIQPSPSRSPPRKRAKSNLNGSISLRSFASLASSRFSTKSSFSRKRKHTLNSDTPSTSGSILSIERHWQACGDFEPEFPYTDRTSESDYVLLNVLGHGRFATVYRAIRRRNSSTNSEPKQLAIKIQDKTKILKAGAEDQIKNEVHIQRLLGKNKFVAEFFGSWQTSNELFTTMAYVDGIGDLWTLFNEYGEFSEQVTCLYSVEIALGLEYLHNQNIVHRDLKMENLSLDSSLHIKFIDYGFAKQLEPGKRTMTICGTLQFLAPEISKEQPYGFEVDWFSLGILLFVMRTGKYPFPNNLAVTHRDLKFECQPFPETLSEELKSVLEKLLQLNPNERLCSAAELFRQPFYENVNIEGIQNQDVVPYEIIKNEHKTTDRLVVKMSEAFDEHYNNFDLY